jgi:hypothetical protein
MESFSQPAFEVANLSGFFCMAYDLFQGKDKYCILEGNSSKDAEDI